MPKTRFTSPIMRMVQGSVDEAQTTDAQGQPRVIKSGPNAGQPNPQYFVAGAIAKNDPAWPAFWALIVTQAAADFPALFPHGTQSIIEAGGPQPWFTLPPASDQQAWVMHPQFAFKVLDGDGMDTSGKLNSSKEGFAGCWVVRFNSAYPPRCFYAGRYAASEQIQEKGAIKRGYFIRVNGSVDGNGNAQRPGIYVNLDLVELAGTGPEIVSGPDAADAFGGAAPPLPPAASPLPLGGAPAPVAAPPVPLPVAAPPVPASPAPIAAPSSPAPAPAPAPAPYGGFMPPAAPAPTAAAPVPAPAPSAPVATPSPTSGPVMTAAAGGASYEAMIAAGWTDATLREHGMMA